MKHGNNKLVKPSNNCTKNQRDKFWQHTHVMAGRERLVVERERDHDEDRLMEKPGVWNEADWGKQSGPRMQGSHEMGPTSFQIWLRWRGKKGQFADADSNRFPVSATSAISCSPSGHPHPRVVLVFLYPCAQGQVQLVLNYQENIAHGNPATNKSGQMVFKFGVYSFYLFIVL